MRTPRVYCDSPIEGRTKLELTGTAAKHLARVLRLGEGDQLAVFDGTGGEYHAGIDKVGRDHVVLNLTAHHPEDRDAKLQIHLVQAIAKGDKTDWIVQKAVELGAASVRIIATERSVVRLSDERAEKRLRHWQGVAIAACEQCGRNRLPAILPFQSLHQYLRSQGQPSHRLMLHPAQSRSLNDLPLILTQASVLIGPEGGFSEGELAAAEAAGYERFSLGPRVLRTETAAVAAITALQVLRGDLLT